MIQGNYFYNKSGTGYYFEPLPGEIKGKYVDADSEKKHFFTEEEIENNLLLQKLIREKKFLPINQNINFENKKIKIEEEKKIENNEIAVTLVKTRTPLVSIDEILKRNNSDLEIKNRKENIKDDQVELQIKTSSSYEEENCSFGSIDYNENQDDLEICWIGPYADNGGYGKMNREIIRELKNMGVKIEIGDFGTPADRCKVKELPFIDLDVKVKKNAISIWGMIPPRVFDRECKRKIVFTMIESEGVHPRFIEKCNFADEIWTPSFWNYELFTNSGIKPPVYCMPLGVNTDLYKPYTKEEAREKLQELGIHPMKTKSFSFFSLFGWSYRKGADILLRSYLEEFTAKDDVSLVIMSRYWNRGDNTSISKVRDDIKDFIKKYCKNPDSPPHIVHIGQSVEEKALPYIFSLNDVFLLPSRGEGYCTLPDAKIKTENGIKKIKDIKVGERVFTHKGRLRKVIKKFERNYDGNMVELKCFGRSNQKLVLTPNHQVRSIQSSTLSSQTRSKLLSLSKYDFKNDKLIYTDKNKDHNNCKYSKLNLDWIDSNKISKGDLLFYPSVQYNSKKNQKKYVVDLNKYKIIENNNLKIKNGKVFSTRSNQNKKKYIVKQILNFDKFEINQDIARLFGYYVAEGCSNKSGAIHFTFHSNEINYHKDVLNIFKNEFGLNGIKYEFENKNCVCIKFYSKPIALIFLELFKHKARNKDIPDWFFSLNKNLKWSFLKGLFRGDGNFGKKQNGSQNHICVSLSSASENLINKIFDMMLSLGIKSNIKKRIIKNEKTYGFNKEYFSLNITNTRDSNEFMKNINENELFENSKNPYTMIKNYNGGQQLLQVREVNNIEYSGKVYNIAVEEDESYICENIAVHNCCPAAEAGASGLPVITTNHGGQLTFLNQENSYLIDIDGFETNKEISKISSYYENQPFCKLGKNYLDNFKKTMRYTYENYSEAKNKAQKLRNDLINNFTWKHTATKIYNRLKEIDK